MERYQLIAPSGNYCIVENEMPGMWTYRFFYKDHSSRFDCSDWYPTKLGAMREARTVLGYKSFGLGNPKVGFDKCKWKKIYPAA